MQPLTNISGQTQNKYLSVINQPALLVLSGAGASGWDIVLDAVKVNGVNVPLQSSTPGVPSGRAIASLDIRSPFVYAPKAAVDAIYNAIPGAYYETRNKFWLVPCLSTWDVKFVFACVISS